LNVVNVSFILAKFLAYFNVFFYFLLFLHLRAKHFEECMIL